MFFGKFSGRQKWGIHFENKTHCISNFNLINRRAEKFKVRLMTSEVPYIQQALRVPGVLIIFDVIFVCKGNLRP